MAPAPRKSRKTATTQGKSVPKKQRTAKSKRPKQVNVVNEPKEIVDAKVHKKRNIVAKTVANSGKEKKAATSTTATTPTTTTSSTTNKHDSNR